MAPGARRGLLPRASALQHRSLCSCAVPVEPRSAAAAGFAASPAAAARSGLVADVVAASRLGPAERLPQHWRYVGRSPAPGVSRTSRSRRASRGGRLLVPSSPRERGGRGAASFRATRGAGGGDRRAGTSAGEVGRPETARPGRRYGSEVKGAPLETTSESWPLAWGAPSRLGLSAAARGTAGEKKTREIHVVNHHTALSPTPGRTRVRKRIHSSSETATTFSRRRAPCSHARTTPSPRTPRWHGA